MFIIQNDNTDAHLIRLQQQIDELRSEARIMRAEIDRLKADPPAKQSRQEYMRAYMAKRRAERKASAE